MILCQIGPITDIRRTPLFVASNYHICLVMVSCLRCIPIIEWETTVRVSLVLI